MKHVQKFMLQIEDGDDTRHLVNPDDLAEAIRLAALVVVMERTTGKIPAVSIVREESAAPARYHFPEFAPQQ